MAQLKDTLISGSLRVTDTIFTTDLHASGEIYGNAATATKLQTARTINGTNFDGSAAITTTNWGTARNISISDSDGTNTGAAVSVNGSAAVTLKLPSTIKASLTGNADTATTLQNARTIWGQSFNGSANITGVMTNMTGYSPNWSDVWSDGTNSHPWYGYDHRYPNTGVFSSTWSDYFGLTLKTASGYISMKSDGKVGIGTTTPSEKLSVDGWVGTIGNTGWYSITHKGGMWMSDANWIRNYNSKPMLIEIGTNNAWGIGTHRLALALTGSNHVSMLLNSGNVGYGFCVNTDGNWYFGRRTNGSATSASDDVYLYYGNTNGILPYADNSRALGDSSRRWKTCYAITFYGALSGNADTATKATQDSDGHAINSTYFKLTETRAATTSNTFSITNTTASTSTTTGALKVSGGVGVSGDIYANKVYNAVWNDYAEYRKCDELAPGMCVQENDDGKLTASNHRLIPACSIITDTFGFSEGETDDAKTPVAVAGRVLAYTYLPRHMYHAGMAVCSAPGGTIDIMTREEIRDYPDCIIGYVSEIPDYEEWGSGNVKVNGRIWIKVK